MTLSQIIKPVLVSVESVNKLSSCYGLMTSRGRPRAMNVIFKEKSNDFFLILYDLVTKIQLLGNIFFTVFLGTSASSRAPSIQSEV